jgi:ankyrin repeat protein
VQIKKQLPARASIEQLKRQAKDLVSDARRGDPTAVERIRFVLPRAVQNVEALRLADAQLVLAREYGLPNWSALKSRVEAIDLADPVTAFIEAACVPMDGSWHASGTTAQADAILAAHPEVTAHDIYTAALLGDESAVRRIVEKDPAQATAGGGLYDWDPLTYLCFSRYLRLDAARSEGFVRAARVLLENGASATTGFYEHQHEPEPAFETAIYGAAGIAGNAELTRLLLEHGADPNDGETPYHVPERYDNAALRVLVESGKVDADGITTMLARKHDWHDYDGMVWLLEHGADPNRMTHWGRRALHKALDRCNALRFVEALLDHDADPALPAKNGKSAVATAARMGRGDVLELFERRGFSIELELADALLAACVRGDATALDIASRHPNLAAALEADDPGILANVAGAGNTAAVRLLLDLGFNVASRTGIPGFSNDTALHLAVWRSRHATAKLLIERGAPLEVTNRHGETPLAYAVRGRVHSEWTAGRSAETVAALLAAGAHVEAVSCFPSGDAEVDELLRRRGKKPIT